MLLNSTNLFGSYSFSIFLNISVDFLRDLCVSVFNRLFLGLDLLA